jgi:hypothetical protein
MQCWRNDKHPLLSVAVKSKNIKKEEEEDLRTCVINKKMTMKKVKYETKSTYICLCNITHSIVEHVNLPSETKLIWFCFIREKMYGFSNRLKIKLWFDGRLTYIYTESNYPYSFIHLFLAVLTYLLERTMYSRKTVSPSLLRNRRAHPLSLLFASSTH